MKTKILVITPVTKSDNEKTKLYYSQFADANTEIDVYKIERGPETIESYTDEAYAQPFIIDLATSKVKEKGYNAIVVDCFLDPGVDALMEIFDIPVIGPGRTSINFASLICKDITILVPIENLVTPVKRLANEWKNNLVETIRVIPLNIPVAKIHTSEKDIIKQLSIQEFKNTDCIIFGCTGFAEVAESLKKTFRDIVIINPVKVSVKYAEMMTKLNITHSKRTFKYPPSKSRTI